MIDSTSVRVHQHAANGKKGETAPKPRLPPLSTQLTPDAWGARAGGLTTKIHAANYLALVKLASAKIVDSVYESVT